jgi:hypothetical protein
MKGRIKYQKRGAKSSGKRGKSTGSGEEGCGIISAYPEIRIQDAAFANTLLADISGSG